ncbi:MAG: deoxyribose-phosphate aldolase [Pseudomonadota bacterium]
MAAKPTAYDPSRFEAEIAEARAATGTKESARRALEALDFTTLQDTDGRQGTETPDQLASFLETAKEPVDGSYVATVCLYPNKIRAAQKALRGTGIGITTVMNFPMADQTLRQISEDTRMAVKAGATEIDVVMPFSPTDLALDPVIRAASVQAAREAAPKALLKVILETNQIQDPQVIYEASRAAIDAGADMLKTSTGKNDGDVTLEHAAAMLAAIRDSGKDVGLKISKGVKTNDQAAQFITLANKVMGDGWADDKQNFRFGASGLRDDLVAQLAPPKPGDKPARSAVPGSDY